MKNAIIFVHPWMWTDDVFEACRRRNYVIISIITKFEKIRINTEWLEENSDFCLSSHTDVNEDAESIKILLKQHCLSPVFVINGIDAAFGYSDTLSRALNTPPLARNADLFLNKSRLNKHLEANGVPVISGCELTSTKSLLEHKEYLSQIGYPLLAKPSEDTAAMADVKIIDDEDALQNYLSTTLGKPNQYYIDRVIKKVLVQKYIPSTSQEFFVDYLSTDGKHVLVGAGKYCYDKNRTLTKIDVYASQNLVIPDNVFTYLSRVLDISGMQNGFTHNEVFLTEDNEILLVESNPRHCGQPGSTLYKELYGRHRMDVLLDAIEQCTSHSQPETLQSGPRTCALFLYNFSIDKPTRIDINGMSSEVKVISFRGMGKSAIPRDFYNAPERSNQISAILMLSNDSETQLNHDCETLRSREHMGSLFFS